MRTSEILDRFKKKSMIF